MEGHSELDHNEKTEEILEALAKRHSYSNLDQAAGALEDAVQAGPHSSPTSKSKAIVRSKLKSVDLSVLINLHYNRCNYRKNYFY